jgi:hypothetical protein
VQNSFNTSITRGGDLQLGDADMSTKMPTEMQQSISDLVSGVWN